MKLVYAADTKDPEVVIDFSIQSALSMMMHHLPRRMIFIHCLTTLPLPLVFGLLSHRLTLENCLFQPYTPVIPYLLNKLCVNN